MDYIYYDLKQQERDKTVEVTLRYAANIRLIDIANFISFQKGLRYQFIGGFYSQLKTRIKIPYNDHWVVIIDLGGHSGIIQGSVKILNNEDNKISDIPFETSELPDEVDADASDQLNIESVNTIIFCEGAPNGKNANFDSQCYNIIFKNEYPHVQFYSLGSCNDVENNKFYQVIKHFLPDKNIYRLIDRDDKSDFEVIECLQNGIRVLDMRSIESYLLDNEILTKICNQHSPAKIETIMQKKEESMKASIERGNPPNDIKSAAGELVNFIKKELNLVNCGNTTFSFLRDTMAPLVTQETIIYQFLKRNIFELSKNSL